MRGIYSAEQGASAPLFLEERELRASDFRFGAPYHDGYGINCESHPLNDNGVPLNNFDFTDLSGPDLIKFGIESKFSCTETSTAAFQRAITSALREMRQLCSPEPMHRDAPAFARL